MHTPLRLVQVFVVLLSLDIALTAKVMPMKPHKIDHSVTLRRILAKRGRLDALEKRKRVARSDYRIIERFDPEYSGPGTPSGVEWNSISADHRATQRRSSTASHRHFRLQGGFLDATSTSASLISHPSGLEQVQSANAPLSGASDPSSNVVSRSAPSSTLGAIQLVEASMSVSTGGSSGNPSATVSGLPSASPSHGPAPSGQEESVPLNPSSGIAYTVEVKVGDDAEVADLVIDTGSSVFWVCSKDCATCKSAGMQLVGDVPADAPNGGKPLTYGMGTVETYKPFKTKVALGDEAVQNYVAMAATEIDVIFQSYGDFMSGIFPVGMTPDPNQALEPDTLIDVMYANGTIASPLVGFYLAPEDSGDTSLVVIGDPFNIEGADLRIDFDKRANLTQARPDDPQRNSLYNVMMDDFKINGMSLSGMQKIIATTDTGSTDFFLPPKYIDGIFNTLGNGHTWKVNVQGGDKYVLPCNLYPNDTDVISLVFQGVEFGVQWQTLIGPEIDGLAGACIPRIDSISSTQDMFILGDAFLINVFHIVNTQTGEVTFYGYQK